MADMTQADPNTSLPRSSKSPADIEPEPSEAIKTEVISSEMLSVQQVDIALQRLSIEKRRFKLEEKRAVQDYQGKAHKDVVSKDLARYLVLILAGSFLLQFSGIVILSILGHNEALDTVKTTFNVWLPVVSGLVSGAVGFYFGKDK
jgi:hypothetical protein